MPRKLPTSYVRKLNEEQKRTASSKEARPAGRENRHEDREEGKLKSFTMICQTCGSHAKFTVSKLGYATCSNCRAQAAYRIGVA
jgi:hypothetical protein